MKKKSYVVGGFKLGLLLQIGGIGPICVLLFQLPAFLPLATVFLGLLGVTLADSLYIGLAAAGIAPLIQKIKAAEKTFKILSGTVLVILGLFFVSFAGNQMQIGSAAEWLGRNIFWGLFLLTLMNPATIVVFTGIFTAEVINRKLGVKELMRFASGVILSTPAFLGMVTVFGFFTGSFLPESVIKALNIIVGVLLVYWGVSQFSPKLCFGFAVRKGRSS